MGSVEVDSNVYGEKPERKRLDSISKLHDLVHKLEEDGDIPPSPTKTRNILFENHVNGDIKEADEFSLENVKPLNQFDIDADLDSEDSWLYESPSKTPGKPRSAENWLRSNVSTPELLRVRGSLSATLEVIAIENRKGQYMKISHRKESHERRYCRGGQLGASSLSLDWDYEEGNELGAIGDFESEPYQSASRYDSDPEPDDLDGDLLPPKIAWSARQPKTVTSSNQDGPFSLDWSDDEEDLKPMKIDFSSTTGTYRKSKPTVGRRSGPAVAVVAPRQNNDSPDDLVVKSRGGIKPRGIPTSRDESPQPRKGGGIAKPVQRRKIETPDNEVTPRLRGSASATQLVKPRSSSNIQKSTSATDVSQSDDFRVRLPNSGADGPVIRRRGAPPVGDSSGPTPRRSKEPSQSVARVQGIPQVRRSTGSIPQKSDGIPRPRQSLSPNTNIVRPRGQAVGQSYQQDY